MDNLYYVCHKYDNSGISYFNNEDGTMTCIRTSENVDEWKKCTLAEAIEIRRHTNYEIVEVIIKN